MQSILASFSSWMYENAFCKSFEGGSKSGLDICDGSLELCRYGGVII